MHGGRVGFRPEARSKVCVGIRSWSGHRCKTLIVYCTSSGRGPCASVRQRGSCASRNFTASLDRHSAPKPPRSHGFFTCFSRRRHTGNRVGGVQARLGV